MTKRNTSIHEIELLSAYLDGHLNRRKRASLEARLCSDSKYYKQYEGLLKTRTMLRSLPRIRAPHNFTLSRQTVGVQSPSRLPGLFGAVSALSSALLIILVIGSLLIGNGLPSSPVDDNQIIPVEIESAVEEEEALPMELEAAAPTEAVVVGTMPPSEESSRYAEPSPEFSLIPPAANYPAPEEAPLFEIQAAPTATDSIRPTQTSLPTTIPSRAPTPTPLPEDVIMLDVPAGLSEGETLPEGTSAKVPEPTQSPPASALSTILLTGEIFLAGVAMVTALTALILLFRSRR